MRCRLLLVPFLAFTSCFAQDEVEIPAGPALVYEDAFPAQAAFDRPLFVAFHATDPESAYVVLQPGQVFRVPRDGTKSERETFLDLSATVFLDNWEEGLLGFQFDPRYEDNGFIYVYWSEKIAKRAEPMATGRTAESDRQSVISRFATKKTATGRVVDPESALRLLEVFQPFGNHNGGTILFGPDGMLYVALGDGGKANDPYCNSESLAMLLGKVLRIDVRDATKEKPYTIPADNPFVGREGARGEIWCYGLRNAWRIAFDRQTGDLWCGDVGQNRVEEVDRLVKGGFYGWNSFEGSEKFQLRRSRTETPPEHILPVAEYSHSEGLSITGGHVYRGEKIAALRGFFIYGDFMTKRMWGCREGEAGAAATVVTLAPAPLPPSSFAEEPDGELLMTCFAGRQGKVFRLVPAAGAKEK